MRRIADLLDVHALVDRWLSAWELAVVCGADATVFAESTCGLLRWHLTGEELVLLPVFDERAGHLPHGADGGLIRRDHRLIERRLAVCERADGLELLAELERLAELLAHHDQRERLAMKSILDTLVSDDERAAMLARVEEGWNASWADVPDVEPGAVAMDVRPVVADARAAAQRAVERVPRAAGRLEALLGAVSATERAWEDAPSGSEQASAALHLFAACARVRRLTDGLEAHVAPSAAAASE